VAQPSQTRAFRLTRIAETGARFSRFGPYVASVNDAGLVAFQAGLAAGGSSAFTGDGGPASQAVAAGGDLAGVYSHPDVNAGGDLCLYGTLGNGAQGVFLVKGGRLGAIAVAGGEFQSIGPLGPTMNDRGGVAFRATLASGAAGVFRSEGSSVATVADTNGPFASFHGLPVINAGGAVAFRADRRDGVQGIYVSRGGSIEAVAETGGEFNQLAPFPSMNDTGTVAFAATLGSGASGIFAAAGGRIDTLVGGDGKFESFRGALVNGRGLVAFYATPRGGRLGVYGGADPAGRPVIALGEPLLGSIVSEFALNPVSVNEAAQIAVRVALADGRQAIVRADPAG
jgi:hypothetical protein